MYLIVNSGDIVQRLELIFLACVSPYEFGNFTGIGKSDLLEG